MHFTTGFKCNACLALSEKPPSEALPWKQDYGLVQFSNRKIVCMQPLEKREDIFIVHLFLVETFPRKHKTRMLTLNVFPCAPFKTLSLPSKCCKLWYSVQVAKSLIPVGSLLPYIDFLLHDICRNVFFPWNTICRNYIRPSISSQPNYKSKTGNSKRFNTSFMFI